MGADGQLNCTEKMGINLQISLAVLRFRKFNLYVDPGRNQCLVQNVHIFYKIPKVYSLLHNILSPLVADYNVINFKCNLSTCR